MESPCCLSPGASDRGPWVFTDVALAALGLTWSSPPSMAGELKPPAAALTDHHLPVVLWQTFGKPGSILIVLRDLPSPP